MRKKVQHPYIKKLFSHPAHNTHLNSSKLIDDEEKFTQRMENWKSQGMFLLVRSFNVLNSHFYLAKKIKFILEFMMSIVISVDICLRVLENLVVVTCNQHVCAWHSFIFHRRWKKFFILIVMLLGFCCWMKCDLWG